MAAVAQLIQPATVTQQHKHLVITAMQQHPAAESLEQLLSASAELYSSLISIDTPESQSFADFVPDSQGTDLNDDGDCAVFETVIQKRSTPWLGNLPGARHNFYLPAVEEVLPLFNDKRRGFHARTGIAYGFKNRTLHTRTKALVMGQESVQWLGDAFSGLKPHLQALGTGRVVMWYDIPRHGNGLASTAMPVALPETAWMQAQMEHGTDQPGFNGLDLFPLPAVMYMLYYHPKVSMPAAVDSIEQQRKQVFSKLSSKPGCPPQAAQDLEEMLTMLLRYMLIQSKVVPAVYKYGTGSVDEEEDWSGSYVLFSPVDSFVNPQEYSETEYKLYKSSLTLAGKNAEGVLEHTSSICVCDGIPDASTLNMSEYASKLAMYVQMPHQPSEHFYSAFAHYSSHWSSVPSKDPQLHYYSAQHKQFITEPKLTKAVLSAKLRHANTTPAAAGGQTANPGGMATAAYGQQPARPVARAPPATPQTAVAAAAAAAAAGGNTGAGSGSSGEIAALRQQLAAAQAALARVEAAGAAAAGGDDATEHDSGELETPQQQQFSVWGTGSNRGGSSGRGYSRGRYSSDSSRGGYSGDSGRGGHSSRGRYSGGRDAARGRGSTGQRGRWGGYGGYGGRSSGRYTPY
jgi:hypothetical protein